MTLLPKYEILELTKRIIKDDVECTCGKDDLYGSLYYPHADYCLKSKL